MTDDKPIQLRPTLQVIEGGHGQPIISQPIDPVRLAEQLRDTGAIAISTRRSSGFVIA